MKNSLKWKKSLFSSTYTIYSNNKMVGKLKSNSLTSSASGELKGEKYSFKTKGFFKQATKIIDDDTNRVIGEIEYSNWMTKATLTINDQLIHWKYDNAWNTKWSLSDKKDIDIKYSGTSGNGQIETNTDNALLVLCGLHVTNYYWQASIAIMVAVFIPVYILILN